MNNEEIIEKFIDNAQEINEELEKEQIDEEKLFQLRYKQLVQGFYLNQTNINKR